MSILPSNKSSLELLTLILLTNPKSYIKIYLNILERLSKDLIYLDTEKIQVIFNLLLTDNTIKAKYALQFCRFYINSINPNTYIKEAKEKIYYLNELDEIDEWINLLKIEIKLKDLIIELIDKHGSIKGYFTALKLMERLNEQETLFVLSKLFEKNEVEIQIILYIYLNINFKYKLDFKNYRDFKTRINQNSLKESHEFRKIFSKIELSVKANEFINNLKVGQVIKLRYVSERNNYHLLQINQPINFLLPFEEIKIPKTFNKYETIEAKIIFICYNKNEVYVSTRQLELNNISFNQNYLKQINIDDIVKCKINQRFENKITVSINGYSKKQLGVIYKNKNFFNDIKELDAKVINIKNNTIILEPINLIQSQTSNDLSNLTPLTQIKISKNLKQINIDDIVKCKISQRFENRITVSINGYSKEQLGVIYKDKNFFKNIKELDAKVINIENNIIILEPINLVQSQTSNDLSNLPPLTQIKISKTTKWSKIIEYLKIYSINDIIDLELFDTQIAYLLNKETKHFFTSKKWLINTLCNLGYISFKNNKYTVIKIIETELKSILKLKLSEDKLSANTNTLKNLSKITWVDIIEN